MILHINIKFINRRRYYDWFKAYYSGNKEPNETLQLIKEYVLECMENYLRIIRSINIYKV